MQAVAARRARQALAEHFQAARVRARRAFGHLFARELRFQRVFRQQAEAEVHRIDGRGRLARRQSAESGDQRMADVLDHAPAVELALRRFAQGLLERGQEAVQQLFLQRDDQVSIVRVAADGAWWKRDGHGAWTGMAFSRPYAKPGDKSLMPVKIPATVHAASAL